MSRAVVVCFALILAACASGGRQAPPAWLSGPVAEYPAERYLLGRGQGPTLEQAQDRARAELAKTFQVRIQAVSEDLTRLRRQAGGNQVAQNLEQAVSRRIRTQTDQIVEGIEIADVWRDPERGTFYALAVLDRARAARRLRERMADLDGRSEAALRRGSDPLSRVRGLYAALQAQWTRAALGAAHAVVSARPVPPPPLSPAVLHERLAEALAALPVRPEAEAAPLRAALGDALTALGVTVTEGEGTHRLRAHLDVQPLGQRAGWFWLRGTLRLALVDAQGRPLAAERRPLKAAALDAEQAEARLLTEATREVKALVPRLVLGDGSSPSWEGADR